MYKINYLFTTFTLLSPTFTISIFSPDGTTSFVVPVAAAFV